jgi:hypothetical protein
MSEIHINPDDFQARSSPSNMKKIVKVKVGFVIIIASYFAGAIESKLKSPSRDHDPHMSSPMVGEQARPGQSQPWEWPGNSMKPHENDTDTGMGGGSGRWHFEPE